MYVDSPGSSPRYESGGDSMRTAHTQPGPTTSTETPSPVKKPKIEGNLVRQVHAHIYFLYVKISLSIMHLFCKTRS